MKKVLFFALIITCCLSLLACNSIEVEYYINTNIPTFTCVTGVESTDKQSFSGTTIYEYKCDSSKRDKYLDKYMDYLKEECGFTVVDSDDEYESMITLVNGKDGVIVDISSSDKINVLTYKRS